MMKWGPGQVSQLSRQKSFIEGGDVEGTCVTGHGAAIVLSLDSPPGLFHEGELAFYLI